jgi:hypothetical protein
MTPEQAQSKWFASLDARKTAWRSIIARCDTGEPFMHKETVDILDVVVQSLDVDLNHIRHVWDTSRPLIPIAELIAMAEQVTARLQDLVQRLCGEVPEHSQPSTEA